MKIKTTSQIHEMHEGDEHFRILQSKASLSKKKWIAVDDVINLVGFPIKSKGKSHASQLINVVAEERNRIRKELINAKYGED